MPDVSLQVVDALSLASDDAQLATDVALDSRLFYVVTGMDGQKEVFEEASKS